jgi:hypothetical protein
MHIFLDESGPFTVPQHAGRSVCCVAALAVPDSCLEPLRTLHGNLLIDWNPPDGELKGRTFNKRQFGRVIVALSNLDVVLTIVAIDMGLHSEAAISQHKMAQAERIRSSVAGPEFYPTLRAEVTALSERLARLANPPYVQSAVLARAVAHTLQTVTLHYAQTEPPTLGDFAWRIDAKDKERTEYERLWVEVIKPILQALFMKEPLMTVTEFDYSAMRPFEIEVLPEAPAHLRPGLPEEQRRVPFHSFDARKFVRNLEFPDSRDEPGVQIVDILANAFSRACNGRLKESGWGRLGELMIRDFRDGYALQSLAMIQGVPPRSLRTMPYWPVHERIEERARYCNRCLMPVLTG